MALMGHVNELRNITLVEVRCFYWHYCLEANYIVKQNKTLHGVQNVEVK
jgi:hypothetical protein